MNTQTTPYPYDPTYRARHVQQVPVEPPVRNRRKPAALVAIATAVVTGIAVGLSGLSQGSSHHSSLCFDYAALAQYRHLDPATVTPGQLNDLDRLMHRLAKEAPASARPAINEVVADVDQQLSSGFSLDPNEQAAGNRADAAIQAACPGVAH